MTYGIIHRFNSNLEIERNFMKINKISFLRKLSFILRKYYSIGFNKRNINYLGDDFYYDNRFMPAMLQMYPLEVERIGKFIRFNELKNVLDIGANIGQFARTLNYYSPQTKIYSFEPNKEIFPFLINNSLGKNIICLNFGIGQKNETKKFYFSPEASAEGSLIKENMNQIYERKGVKEIEISMIKLDTNMIKKYELPSKFDLVKIDVEGYEAEVLKSLKEINFRYLQIEVSLKRKGSTFDDIKKIIKENWNKEAKVLFFDIPEKTSPAGNVLIELI